MVTEAWRYALRGRSFVQLPGPTNIPERVQRAMNRPAEDFANESFYELARSCLDDLAQLFCTAGSVYIYAANGHGAWEAALANLFVPGDRILLPDTGRFSRSWKELAEAGGIIVQDVPTDLRHPVEPAAIEAALRQDRAHAIAAVCLVQVETSTGMLHDVQAVRRAIDRAGHPALLVVDSVASFACVPLPMDEWGVDVALAASQKGLMLPAGLAFVAVGARGHAHAARHGRPSRYWDWRSRQGSESYAWFYGTPPTQMVQGLRVAIDMLREEGPARVHARHRRLAEAVKAAASCWTSAGAIEFQAIPIAARSDTVTCLRIPEAYAPDQIRRYCRERLGVAFGGGLGPLQGQVIRIGHLGDLNEPMILGALAVLEMGFVNAGVPHGEGALPAAIATLARRVPAEGLAPERSQLIEEEIE